MSTSYSTAQSKALCTSSVAESESQIISVWPSKPDKYDGRLHDSQRKITMETQNLQSVPFNPVHHKFDAIDFSAGFLAGCTGVITGHPFDTIKVRQQTLGPNYSTMWKCVHNTVTKEGFLGFYKGLLFPLAAQGCINCLFFGVYERIKGNSSASYGQMALAGAVGGAVQSTIANPIELIKIKMQNQTSAKDRLYKGPFHCVSTIVRQHGFSSLSRGLSATTLRDSAGFCLYMTSYEYMCRRFHPEGPDKCSIGQLFVTGGLAGSFSWLLNFPIDTTKSRIQGDCLTSPTYRSLCQSFSLIVQQEGPRALFKGLPAVLLRSFALNAVTLTVYSTCRNYFTDPSGNRL